LGKRTHRLCISISEANSGNVLDEAGVTKFIRPRENDLVVTAIASNHQEVNWCFVRRHVASEAPEDLLSGCGFVEVNWLNGNRAWVLLAMCQEFSRKIA
jgi:hypothetical protein